MYEEEGVRVEAIRGDDPRASPLLFRTMHAIYATTVSGAGRRGCGPV